MTVSRSLLFSKVKSVQRTNFYNFLRVKMQNHNWVFDGILEGLILLFAHISYVVCICVAFNKLVFLAFSYLNFCTWCWNLKMMMIFAFLQIQLCITHFCRTKFLRRTVEINHMITVEISNWHWLLMAWPHINETHENIYDWNSFY